MIFGAPLDLLYSTLVQSDDAVRPVKGTSAGAPDETNSRVCELKDKVKDLERKVANLFMDNVSLTTKLKAGREVERQQREEISSLTEQRLQALRAQVIVYLHFCVAT